MSSPRLPRVMRPIDGVTVVIGGVIGAGIFASPQRVAVHVGSMDGVVAIWLAGAAIVLLGGLFHAEMGTRLPRSGGNYVYLTRAFGPRIGFLEGWRAFMIANPASRAGLAVVTAEYIGHFVPLDPWDRTLVAAAVLIAGGAINYTGVRWSLRYQHLSVVTKVGGLLALAILGLMLLPAGSRGYAEVSPPDPSVSPLGHVVAAMLLVYYAYTGYTRLGFVGAELRDPRRTFPVAVVTGLAIVAVIYLAINAFYVRTLGIEGMRQSQAVAADAAGMLLGPAGASLVAIVAIVSASGCIVTTMMAAPRAYYAMARDRLFFSWLDFVHPRFRTPSRAVFVHTLACLALLFIKRSFVELATSFVFINLVFGVLLAIAAIRLRMQGVGEQRAFRAPLFPLVPLLYMAGVASLVAYRIIHDWDRAAFDLAVLAVGIPAAEIWIRAQRRRGERIGSYALAKD